MFLKSRATFLLVLGLMLFGCSKEQRDQLADKLGQAKDQVANKASEVANKASQAKEKVAADGEAKLTLEKELFFSASYVNMIPVKGRGSVVQLRSYLDHKSESFPSYFFQANTTAASLNSLTGQMVKGTLFVKRDRNEPTWMSASEQLVSLSFDSVVEGKLVGRVVDGKLSSAKGDQSAITGTFEAIIEGGLE